MSAWSWYWIGWAVLGFGVPETIALITNKRNTLSDQVWTWFGVKEGIPLSHWSFLHFFLLAFMAWLFFHFVFGLFR